MGGYFKSMRMYFHEPKLSEKYKYESEMSPPYCTTSVISCLLHGRALDCSIQCSIWENIECSCDAEILKEKIQCIINIYY